MSRSVIGSLRVHLGLDSAQFQAGIGKAQSRLNSFAASAKKGVAVAAAGIAALGGAIAIATRQAINEADNMAKSAQKFGVGVEELTRLKHAADLSGVSMEGLGTGMRVLSRNMLEFANGAKNSASNAFQQLGIDVKNADGTMKSSTQVINEIAGKLSQMQDGAQKTALAMALFGRSGADLIPMLNAGSSGLADMMAEADRLGIVLDTHTAKAAEAFNDNLTRLGRAKDGLIMKLTAELLPALELMSERFLGFVNDGDAITATADAIGRVFEWAGNMAIRVAAGIKGVRAELGGLAAAGAVLKEDWTNIGGAIAAWNDGQAAAAALIADAEKRIADGVMGSASQGQIQRRIDAAFGEAGASAGDTLLDAIETSIGGGGGRVKAAVDPMVREAERIFDGTRNSVERYHMQIARLNELLAAGAIDQDTYNRAVMQAQDAFDQAEQAGKKAEKTFGGIGQTMAWSFSSAFQGILDGSKKVKDALADLLKQFSNMLLNNAFQALFGAGSGGGGGSGGGFWGSLMGALGFRANGGPVSAGRPYIVGERGPELMVPSTGGSVVRNADLGRIGGGGNMAITVNVDGANGDQHVIGLVRQGVAEGLRRFPETPNFRAGVQASVTSLQGSRGLR